MRDLLVMGNWKLHGSTYMVNNLITTLLHALSNIDDYHVAIAPPVMYLNQASQALTGSQISLGAQNVDVNLSGAFTGEISATMLKDVGVQYVIIGHSERRIYHKETYEVIAKKFAILKEAGLTPILCIGETQSGAAEEVCLHQIDVIVKTMGVSAIKNSVIAYEPVWAIGTGKPATPVQAQAAHKLIRNHIANYDASVAEELTIQYGGSVNEKNAAELFAQPDIDGVLIGGASLQTDIFAAIVKAGLATKKG